LTTPKKPRKEFLKLPVYPGGKKAFDLFIRENLKYPLEALENQIEGDVYITYEVSDNGVVLNPVVRHGIGHGCDEEALRLIGILKFPKTTNRGVRVKSRFNTRIPFRIIKQEQKVQLNYSISTGAQKQQQSAPAIAKNAYIWQIPVEGIKE
jgi:TonB family protein